jgi:hypothetical protein
MIGSVTSIGSKGDDAAVHARREPTRSPLYRMLRLVKTQENQVPAGWSSIVPAVTLSGEPYFQILLGVHGADPAERFRSWRRMRAATLPIAFGVTIVLQLLCFAADVPAGLSTVGATAVGCAVYVVLLWMRRASQDEH